MPEALGNNKRRLPAKVAAMKARKRQKMEGDQDTSSKVKRTKTDLPRTKVRADSLPWKDISMPDHLEDYEGFYGLEEVEDVEVVRDPETGRVSFNSKTVVQPESTESDSGGNMVAREEEDEWSGFGDDEDVSDSTTRSTEQTTPQRRTLPAVKTNSKNQAQRNGNVFQDLLNKATGDEASVDISAWKSLNLSPDTLAALSKLGFSKPTPIQQSAIPDILAENDVVGKASTGSGKTLAFGIPILEYFLELGESRQKENQKSPLALILSPTRELAHQLDKHLTALCTNGGFQGPEIATLTGGLSVQKQQRLLRNADIVIGTPGRLWEVISEGKGILESLKCIKFLVVDEADRLLSQGNFKEVEEILNALDRKNEDEDENDAGSTTVQRQTLVFSATFDRSLQRKLAAKSHKHGSDNNLLSNKESMEYLLSKLNFRSDKPKFVDVNPVSHLATGLKESLIECPTGTDKDLYLYTLLLLLSQSKAGLKALVFTNSISAVKRLTPFLQNLNLPALALHSGMAQKARLRSVERFTQERDGKKPESTFSILVATDVAARGLDIPGVQLILHYHLPRAADTYVHRSGRTARAGQTGSSILICAPEEVAGVRRLVAKVHAGSTSSDRDEAAKQGHYIRTLDLDRRVVSRLRPRAALAKKLADTTAAKEKHSKEDDFMRAAAEELGVDYDSDSFAAEEAKGKRGRGAGRQKKEREAKGLSKAEVVAMKAELKALLKQRVNVGVSERYLTSGGVDVDELLRQQDMAGAEKSKEGREFLGSVRGLLEDV